MAAQLCECTKNHGLVYFKKGDLMVYELEERTQDKRAGQVTERPPPMSRSGSYQRPEHREDAGGTHDEQPAQGLGVVGLHHLNHAQKGLHPRPPQVPHVKPFQVHQAGPGAAEDMGPLAPHSATSQGPQHPQWGPGHSREADRQGWTERLSEAGLGTAGAGATGHSWVLPPWRNHMAKRLRACTLRLSA